MSRQNEITEKTPLLREDGSLTNSGFCKHNLYEYNPENISSSKWRLKEWDFYQVCDGHVMVQINFFNIGLASCATLGIVDLMSGKHIDTMTLETATPNKNRMNPNGDVPNYFEYSRGGQKLIYDVKETTRHLYFKGKKNGMDLLADFTCDKLPEHESITMATPFKEQGHFFYTQKLNCLNTEGKIVCGEYTYKFSKKNTFTVLDWGRGVWPYSNMWYWANGSTFLNGKLFGFELTWGFGDENNATETAIFYDGKCHKLSAVDVVDDPEVGESWMRPWHFKSEDGRFDMIMKPFYDNKSIMMPLNVFGMRTHQVHGLWSGKAVLDDGTVLEIKDMYAFCEKVYNKW